MAHRVSCSLPSDRSADALAVLAGTTISLEAAARVLLPGGVLLWEVDRRASGYVGATPRRIRRALERAGLTPVAEYWAKGGHENCSMYLPLRSNRALSWYFRTLFRAGTLGRRTLKGALRGLTAWRGQRFGIIIPSYAVLARAGNGHSGIPAVATENKLPTELQVEDLQLLFLMSGQGDWSRVVAIPFQESRPWPVAVMKLPRTPLYNSQTEHEHSVLLRLRALLDAQMREALPEPRGSFCWHGLSATVEAYVPGTALSVFGKGKEARERSVQYLRLAAGWLVEFHRLTVRGRPVLKTEREQLLDRPFEAYANAFGLTSAERDLFTACRSGAEMMPDVPLPLVWQHRDLGPWNIYHSARGLRVLDWEVAREGPALSDLLYLTMHWIWTASGETSETHRRNDFRRLFLYDDEREELPAAARTEIRSYVAALCIDPGLVPLILVNTVVGQAVDRAERLQTAGQPEAVSREDNRYTGYVAVLAEDPERLFAGAW